MNTFDLVLIVPTLLTIASAGTLYFSFKGRVDASGRYFLSAELFWLGALLIVIAINIQKNFAFSIVLYLLSVFAFLSEIAILISMKALTGKVHVREAFYWTLFVAVYALFIEYCRNYISPELPMLCFAIFSLFLTSITYVTCVRIDSNGLKNNLFIKWITYVELGLTVIHVLRCLSYFVGAPLRPFNPSPLSTIIFSIWFSINLFRYFSYLALRVSWVDPREKNDNPLNANLVKLAREKDQFLQGLISSNRALGISALANSLAHQLSQPITGAMLQAEVVKRDLLEQGGQQKAVQVLHTVTDELGRVSTLVNNLRKLFGAQTLEVRPFDVQDACGEVLELIEPTLKLKKIQLTKSYVDSSIALGDPVHIQQVLINVFNNAIDALEQSAIPNRRIDLSVLQNQNYVVINVIDTGSGIPAGIASSIFDLYQSTKPDGLGIGLWLCKEIMDKHNGSISASNQPKGGALVQIRIPAA